MTQISPAGGITGFAQALQFAQKCRRLYSPEHPRTLEAMTALQTACDALLSDRDRIHLNVSQGKLFIDGTLTETTGLVKELVRLIAERQISGFIFVRGVLPDELKTLVDVLMMKPQQLQQLGGAAMVLAALPHVRLSQVRYEELHEGEAVVSSKSLAGALPVEPGPPVDWNDIVAAMVQKSFAGRGGGSGGVAGGLGPPGAESEASAGAPIEDELAMVARGAADASGIGEALRQQILQMSPEEQVSLLFSLPIGEGEALHATVAPVGSDLFDAGVSAAGKAGFSSPVEMAGFVERILSLLPERDRNMERLRERLAEAGVGEGQLAELIEGLEWQNLELEPKLARALEGETIFSLPNEKVLTFFRHLLTIERTDEFLKLLDRYGKGLFVESPDVRQRVADGMMQIASWLQSPGLPPAGVTALEKLLLTHFIRESDPKIHERCGESLELLLGLWLSAGIADHVYRDLIKIDSAISPTSGAQPWKREQFFAMLDRLCSDRWMAGFIDELYARDPEQIASTYPLLVFLAERAAAPLLRALEGEEDRARRGRLMKAIKTIGKPALAPLRDSLGSPTWYLVRNALNLLGDLTALELVEEVGAAMRHDDARVRRAAARTLGKMGNQRAEALLVEALPREDPETQAEMLGALGAMKAAGAVGAIGDLAKAKRELRSRAVDALAQIGSAEALPILGELLMKKGLLGGDPPELRLAIARAIVSIGTPQARATLQKAFDAEPRGATRDQIGRLLESLPA